MKTLLTGTFTTLALVCSFSFAQDASPASSSPATPQAQQNPSTSQPAQKNTPQAGSMETSAKRTSPNSVSTNTKIAPGTVIPVQITKSIDAKKIKTGDPVEAKVTQDMKAGNGEVLVPKDTKVIGRVTEAQARSKERKESQVAIAFDRAVMKTGGDVSLPMSIQAIIAPSYLNANNNPRGEGDDQAPSASAATPDGMTQSSGNTRGAGMSQSQSQAPTSNDGSNPGSTDDKAAKAAHEPITGNTQGVFGIPDLTLSTGNSAQGSVIASEKNNVKLESGTLMLLKVTGASQ